MGTFNLSMLAARGEQGDVQASPQPEVITDKDTGQTTQKTVTDDGTTINKDIAPKIKLDGPMGHFYTEVLNKELSLESMSAIVSAVADTIEDESATSSLETGKVAMTSQGPVNESTGSDGYIYVIHGDTLESSALNEISDSFLKKRLADPERQLGLAMITDGSPSSTMESLSRCLSAADVRVTFFKSGVVNMARDMLKKDK